MLFIYFLLALSVFLLILICGMAWMARGFKGYPGQKEVGILAWLSYVSATFIMLKVAGVSTYIAGTLIFVVSAIGYFEPEIEIFLVRIRLKDSGIDPAAPKAPIK